MLNLHAIYYRNIGPFEGKECSLLFDQGKFLIKAPIGSGKSFLFFDGPTYALYRTANRNLLNIRSTQGEISLIFSADDQYYLIRRMLKPGKSRDSCSSQFFSITTSKSPIFTSENAKILQRNTNIIAELTTNPAFHLEEIVMKNETDLQQILDQLLPPKPVFLSTIFLLQDAENIFEMQPADRLTVLKNVFGLLGIDEAKEQVQDKKRELSYKLKALQDTSHQDLKLRNWLKKLYDYTTPFQSTKGQGNTLEDFFVPLEGVLDQITLNEFTLNGLDMQFFLTLQADLQAKENALLTLQTTKDYLTKQLNDLNQQLIKGEQEQKKLTFDIAHLEQQIANIDPNKVEKLKQEKTILYQQQEALEDGIQHLVLPSDNEEGEAERRKGISPPQNLSDLFILIQTLRDRGKDLANQIQQAELQLKNIELEAKNQQMKIEQLEQTKKRLADFEISINEQATFACEKIGTHCPFIKVINNQHFDQLEKQKAALKAEIALLEQQRINKPLMTPLPTDEPIPNAILQRQSQIQHIKTFLTTIDYKSREDKYAQKEALQKRINELDQTLIKLEAETQKLQDYQQQKTAFSTSLQHREQQNSEIKQKRENLKAEREELDSKLRQQQPEHLKHQLETVATILQTIHDIEQLIQDATATKNLVKELQHQEKLLTNLYTILSKEILLIALDEYLPVLNDIINSYLVQVVEYQITMKIIETAEKLELEAKIYDEKGEREVKSLSGGQRTILKLVRMLAISSYLQTPLLFLDETINNLDKDTIGKVSEMLNNFVKQRTMKFYTVTHNTEIQEMGIWDSVVEV